MGFEKIKESAGDLHEQAKEFIDVNVEYYKLWSFKILMKSTTMMLKMFLLGIMLLIVTIFFLLFLSLYQEQIKLLFQHRWLHLLKLLR